MIQKKSLKKLTKCYLSESDHNKRVYGLFTMSVCVGDRDIASKRVTLISMVLFKLSGIKH